MTHPTIEKAARAAADRAIDNEGNDGWADLDAEQRLWAVEDAKAAARVVLAAEPSEAEVEAALDAWADGRFVWRGGKDEEAARQCMSRTLKAANAARAKEMGL